MTDAAETYFKGAAELQPRPITDAQDALAALAELERERDELRANLAEYEQARTVATVFGGIRGSSWEPYIRESEDVDLPPPGTELIARPTRKDGE